MRAGDLRYPIAGRFKHRAVHDARLDVGKRQ
jgi:hypothetical protein